MTRLSRLCVLAIVAGALGVFAAPAGAQYLRAVTSRDGQDVVAVGDSGLVMRSVDGGATWLSRKIGSKPLRAVAARGWTILAAGDSGKVWRSLDSGDSWALSVPGTSDLRTLVWPSPDTALVAGDGGELYRSIDAGASWTPLSSGTSARIFKLRFSNQLEGWMVGAAGFAAHTTDGGDSWTPSTTPAVKDLYDVDFRGSTVWAVGRHGVAISSATGGASWVPHDLKLDLRSNVNAVWLQSADSVFISGGGGFVRRSVDGGATWTFLRHLWQSPVAALHFEGPKGWLCGPGSPAVLRTSDLGANWSLPSGTIQRRSWIRKHATGLSVRGATLAMNPLDEQTFYCMLGPSLYRSRNEGETWSLVSTVPGGSTTKTNAFIVSPKDTNLMLAAVGVPDRIVRSTDAGASWSALTFPMNFGEYGIPLERDPQHPDTVLFGPDDNVLYRSKDFGLSWDPYSATTFRSPCDLIMVPDSDSGVVIVGDGITSIGTGEILRSNDHGLNFVKTFSPSSPPAQASEIPGLSISRLRTGSVFGTAWSGGAFKRSVNNGLTWSNNVAIGSSWGTDVAKDDPDVVVFATYSFGTCMMSFDGGDTYGVTGALGSNNYSFFARDRALILAEEGNGIYKLVVVDSFQINVPSTVTVNSPNGGEVWTAGEPRTLTWNAARVPLARIQWRPNGTDPWTLVALVDGYAGAYDWTVPNVSTTDARVRVSDAWDASPADECNAPFTIQAPGLLAAPDPLDLGSETVGNVAADTLHLENTGSAPLTITAVASDDADFWPGRTSVTLAPGACDTLGVFFKPLAAGLDSANFTLTSNDASSPAVVLVVGAGEEPVGVEPGGALEFALEAARPNPFARTTLITFTLPTREDLALDVFDLQGHRVATLARGSFPPGRFSVSFGPGARDADGRPLGSLASGVYFYRLRAGAFFAARKVLLVR